MAGRIRLTDGGNTIDFSPTLGYERPYARRESVNVTLSGKRYVHKWNMKERLDPPIINVSQADHDQFFTWWDSKTELTCTPDLDAEPGTTFTAKLMGDDWALQLFSAASFVTYRGTLLIVEV